MSRAIDAYGRAQAVDEAERRREIVTQHASLVKRVAMRLVRAAPGVVELDDLYAAGIIGLLQAAETYDPAGGRSFEVFAEFRVKGAMLDELRSRDPLPRRTRHRVNLARRAIAHTRLLRGRDPTDDELATALGTNLDEVNDLKQYLEPPIAIDAFDDRVAVPGDLLPSDALEEAEERTLVQQGLKRLPDRYRTLLALYYEEGLNYKQIGKIQGVSEATVCRQHKESLRRLKEIVHSLPAPSMILPPPTMAFPVA